MSDFQISETEIEQLLAEPIVEFESNETDRLLASPPIVAARFRFAGDMSLSRALAHDTLGPALKDFHDRLVWSKDEPELGAGGIELFRLNHSFVRAGHPIIAMPPPRVAADIIWDQTMRLLEADYLAATNQSRCGPSLSPVLLASTIHGSVPLLKNNVRIHCEIINAWNREQPRLPVQRVRPGTVQFEEYAQMAEEAVIRAAERYDPARSSFPTYIHHRLRGVVKDYLDSSVPLLPISLDAPALDDDDVGETIRDRQPDIVGSYFPGGQKSAIPVPSDHWLVEGLTDLRLEKPLARLNDISAKAGLNERERIICANLLRPDPVQWKELAAYFGVSASRVSAMVLRTIEKIRAAY